MPTLPNAPETGSETGSRGSRDAGTNLRIAYSTFVKRISPEALTAYLRSLSESDRRKSLSALGTGAGATDVTAIGAIRAIIERATLLRGVIDALETEAAKAAAANPPKA